MCTAAGREKNEGRREEGREEGRGERGGREESRKSTLAQQNAPSLLQPTPVVILSEQLAL